jgi:hypothetical protein
MHRGRTQARSIRLAALGATVASCTVDGRDEDFDGSFGSAGMTDAGASSDGGAESSDGIVPGDDDGGAGETDTGGATIRCDKIDILFVMETGIVDPEGDAYFIDDQAVFEGFATLVSELYVSLAVDDFRVMVTGSMSPAPVASCLYDDATMMQQCAEPIADDCDDQLGAGRNGFDYSLQSKFNEGPIAECMDGRWLESGTPDLEVLFRCLFYYHWFSLDATGGSGGERTYAGTGPDTMMDATLAAVGPLAQPGACNGGFVRDDALLVVVFVSPSSDAMPDTSSGTVAEWSDALAQAKHGIAGNVVTLALVGDGDVPQSLCGEPPNGSLPAQLRELVDAMPHGKWASTCLPDYKPFFTSASELVDAACSDFTPEG